MDKIKLLLISLLLGGGLVIKWYIQNQASFDRRYSGINIEKAYDTDNLIPVAILGSGPAGLSASIYSGRANIKTVVVHGNKPGGQLTETTWVENWPGKQSIKGPDIIKDLRKQAENFGVDFFTDAITKVDFSSWPYKLETEDRTLNAMSVIIATGSSPRKMGVPGEKEYWGKGITSCAICDAPFYKGKEVVVVGGGDSAIEEALQLARYAKKITILVRRNSMRAAAKMQDKIKDYKKIKVMYNTQVKRIEGDGNHVTSLDLINKKNDQEIKYPADGVFLAIGHIPNTGIFKEYIDLVGSGHIKHKLHTQETSLPGVFAAGDVADNRYRQAGVAAGNGIKAALDALMFLERIGFDLQISQELECNYFDECDVTTEKIDNISNLKQLDKELEETMLPIIIEFSSESCPCCVQMLNIIQRVSHSMKDKAKFFTIEIVDENSRNIARKYGIKTVPSIIAFDTKGRELRKISKALSKNEMYKFVEEVVAESLQAFSERDFEGKEA